MFDEIMQRLTELERQLANVVSYGMVSEVDYDKALCKVQIGENVTGWLHWAAVRAGGDRDWRAPEQGEQVTVLSPNGDLAQGIVMFSIYQQAAPAPANSKDVTLTKFGDGFEIEHNRAKKLTYLNALDSGGTLVLEAKNLILRTGEFGYYQLEHNGKATRITHMGGVDFKTEVWDLGSMVTGIPDHGYSPPEITTPEEA